MTAQGSFLCKVPNHKTYQLDPTDDFAHSATSLQLTTSITTEITATNHKQGDCIGNFPSVMIKS